MTDVSQYKTEHRTKTPPHESSRRARDLLQWNLRSYFLMFVAACIFLAIAQTASAYPPQDRSQRPRVFNQREQTFVAGLMKRRLYDVAQKHCLDLLGRKEIQVADQSALTVQLIQTRTSMALTAESVDATVAEDAWQAVWQTSQDFASRFPQHPGSMQVSIQIGLAHLRRARRIGNAIEAQMLSAGEVTSATAEMLEQCRAAQQIFASVERAIQRLLPERRSKAVAEGELSPQELLSLRSSVRYQIALCQFQIAAAYQSTDLVAWQSALDDVLQRLQEVQDSVIPSQPIWWRSKVSQLECLLKLKMTDQVERQLSTLPQEGPPPELLPNLIRQQLMLAIASGDIAKLQAHLATDSVNSAELALVQIQAAVELSKLLNDPLQQKSWLEDASRRRQQVQLRYGPWWGRRAGLTLVQAAGESASVSRDLPTGELGKATRSAAVELLIQTALQSQRDGDLDDALKAYDRAIGQSSMPQDVLRLQIRAAQILEQQSRPALAAKRLIAAAAEAPEQPLSAATHLRGIWNLARAGAAANRSSSDLPKLIQSLNRHLTTWPLSPTKNTAALWLMAEHIRFNRPEQTLTAFDAVESQSDSFVEAVSQLRALFFKIKQNAEGNQQSSKKLAREIVARLRVRYDDLFDVGGRETNNDQRAVMLLNVVIEVGLESEAVSVRRLSDWLADFLQRTGGEDSASVQPNQLMAWSSLLTLLNDSTLQQSDVDASAKVLADSRPDQAMCRRLFRVVSNRESQLAEPRAGDEQALSKRRALRLYGLEIIEIVNRLPLSARDSDRWKFQWGSLLRKTRQFERAIALLEPLAQRFHGDLKIQQEFARALSATKSPTRQPDALKAWRRLAKSLTPATENWYEARLNVARQLQSSGDREGAKKLLLFTRSVYGWDDTAWRDDLGRLLRELRTLSTP